MRSVVERFVAAAAQPAVLDPGEEPLRLLPDQWQMSEWNGRLVLQAWSTERNLVRRITGIREQQRDRLSLTIERFPKTEGELAIADLAAPAGVEWSRRTSRQAFRDRFRLMLAREIPDARIEEISAEANLEQSLSPAFVRAFLRSGSSGVAAMAAPPDSNDCGAMVAFGLIWLHHLRQRERRIDIRSLLLFMPAHREREVSSRAALIDGAAVSVACRVFDEKDRTGLIDFADAGNVESSLPPCRRPLVPNSEPPEFPHMPEVDRIPLSDGSVSLRIRGLEFARWTSGKLSCGIGRRKRCLMETVAAMAGEVARLRNENAEDRQHPLYSRNPEGWLESQVRANPGAIDPEILPTPLYGQVPIFSSPDRGVIDLLGVDRTGRLAVLELKATADLQLPFQAIDYWLRVRNHLMAGDFERLGYFPGITLRRDAPRLLLVAPALEFHSTSESIIRCLSPAIEITRIGMAADWRRELRVMFRLRGAERP